jgi:hypothetical protein
MIHTVGVVVQVCGLQDCEPARAVFIFVTFLTKF